MGVTDSPFSARSVTTRPEGQPGHRCNTVDSPFKTNLLSPSCSGALPACGKIGRTNQPIGLTCTDTPGDLVAFSDVRVFAAAPTPCLGPQRTQQNLLALHDLVFRGDTRRRTASQ
jgi:hypothetical protein